MAPFPPRAVGGYESAMPRLNFLSRTPVEGQARSALARCVERDRRVCRLATGHRRIYGLAETVPGRIHALAMRLNSSKQHVFGTFNRRIGPSSDAIRTTYNWLFEDFPTALPEDAAVVCGPSSQRTLSWRKADSNSQSRVASRYRHVLRRASRRATHRDRKA